MYQVQKIKSPYIFLLLSFLFISGCSYPEPPTYPPANPIVFAFQHSIDLERVKEAIDLDSLATLDTIEGGIKLFTNSIYGGAYEMETWLKDSLMLVNIKAFRCNHWESLNTTSGKVRLEKRLRKERENLYAEVYKNLDSGVLSFYNISSFIGEDEYEVIYHRDVPLEIQKGQITKMEYLSWQGNVFGKELELNFKEEGLEGASVIRDTHSVKHGIYSAGFEEGEWKVFDTTGNLQWTEIYQKGELQDVVYEKEATLERQAPLPTLRSTVIIHRLVFYVFLIITIVLIYFYIKSLLNTKRPYKGNKALEIFLKVMAGPFFSAASILIFYVIFMLFYNLGEYGFTWDLPLDFFLMLFFSLCYFLIGTIFFIATFRYLDVFWHGSIITLIYLLTEEYQYLQSLEIGIF